MEFLKLKGLGIKFWTVLILSIGGMLIGGCSVKHAVKVDVAPDTKTAKTASFSDLRQIIASYGQIQSLSSNDLHLTLTSGRKESGRLYRYRKVSGYILLKRPDAARLVIKSPVISTTIFDLVSIGDNFRVWIPSRNKFYTRENNAEGDSFKDDLPAIPNGEHIFEDIFPQSIDFDSPGIHFSEREETEAGKKYYVISTFEMGSGTRLYPLRTIWIERSNLTIARQQEYREDGQIIGDIHYSQEAQIGGFFLPLKIHIERPLDGYTLDIEFKTWRINPGPPDKAFDLVPPPKAKIVHLGKSLNNSAEKLR